MKVFVAGATGVVGRRAVRALLEAGHEVTAVARTAAKASALRRMGAIPVEVDLFDPTAVAVAVQDHEAVVNLATKIPPPSRAGLPRAWNENDRIRREGSRNLVDAALAAGASRYIQESIAFCYADRGSEWIEEGTPVPEGVFSDAVLAAEGQAHRFSEQGGTGVVLRFGMFYGHDATHTQWMVSMVRSGLSPFIGRGDAHMPMLHLDDAATAVVEALDAPSGVYNVVDDEPLTRKEHTAVLAHALDRRRVVAAPPRLTRLGGSRLEYLSRSQRVSNQRFCSVTGWAPAHPSTKEGFPAVVSEMGVERSRYDGWRRVILGVLGLIALQLGVWATIAPRGFYDDFPGAGRTWVSVDGPYNEHFVRDFGGLNLALFVLTAVALWKLTPLLVRTAAVAWLVFSIPHLVYHARHLEPYGTSDAIANMVALSLAVALPAALLLLPSRRPSRRPVEAAHGT